MTPPSCKQNCDELSLRPPGALYVHVPFCLRKCRYCDFYSLPHDPAAAGDYVEAALVELGVLAGELRVPLETVYFGGGTPTALGEPILRRLLAAARPLADARTEFTVEANPGTVSESVAAVLAEHGVNRVALGVQSFQPAELQTLGRIHTPAEAVAAVSLLRAAGISNIGIDLIYGIPGQTIESWKDSLASAAGLQPRHLSAYALSFEEGTPLWEDLQRGRDSPMEELVQKECYHAAIDALARAGLEHYEISNFARAGRRCRHNLTYWHNLPYLGIGPAAASYVRGIRRTNTPDLSAYLKAIRAGLPPPCTPEQLTLPLAMAETMMLGLRLIEGIDRRQFARRFGVDATEAFPKSLRLHQDLGTLLVEECRIRIPRESLFISDAVLADIVAEAQGN